MKISPANLLHQSIIANVLFRLNLHIAAIEMKGYVISEVSYLGTEPDLLLATFK